MKRSIWLFLFFALISIGFLLYSLQANLDITKNAGEYKGEDFLYLPKAEYLKTASLGYEQVTADLLWLKAVQHLGGRKVSPEAYEWVYKAIDTVTTLDPKFISPYEVGGLLLSMYSKIELSNNLFKKAAINNPEEWQFPFYLGFNYFFYQKDYKQAAAWISKAAAIKGSPPYLPLLASRLYVQARDPAYALEFLSRMYENTKDEKIREELMQRMNLLRAEIEIKVMQSAVDIFRKGTGRPPENLGQLVRAGLLKYIPDEPNGGRYYIDGQGNVKSTRLDAKLGVYIRGQK